MAPPDAARAIEAVWRLESARIIGALTRLVRDVGLAQELAQDALVSAVEEWPVTGVPPNPGGWLMLTARHRAIDRLRRDDRLRANVAMLGREAEERQRVDVFAEVDDEQVIQDDVLRLVFIACHPVLPTTSRVALTLRLLGGLSTDEIARAFLVPEPTVAQRIVRAKRTLADKRVPFEVPEGEDMMGRLASVLEVVYLIFNEGHSATAGDEWVRPELCHEALRLGRMLAELAPAEPEVHGLVALMEIQASRLRARVDADGRPVPLLEQNRGRWDQLLIRRGYAALLRARELGRPPGPYVLQAAIAACHARARTPEETDWPAIVALYEALSHVAPTPVVALNHAVAVAMASGPEEGLRMVDDLAGQPSLAGYHLLPAVRGDLLAQLGRDVEARDEFRRAAELTANARERAVLAERASAGHDASGHDASGHDADGHDADGQGVAGGSAGGGTVARTPGGGPPRW
ncbi:MAG TPA: RNA polymerase sigma factor [Micromonosporaceae bacterium]|nr:RNA polymerase sigma factor [Micromonosporaceae bacterium]